MRIRVIEVSALKGCGPTTVTTVGAVSDCGVTGATPRNTPRGASVPGGGWFRIGSAPPPHAERWGRGVSLSTWVSTPPPQKNATDEPMFERSRGQTGEEVGSLTGANSASGANTREGAYFPGGWNDEGEKPTCRVQGEDQLSWKPVRCEQGKPACQPADIMSSRSHWAQ